MKPPVISDYKVFLDKFFEKLEEGAFDVEGLKLDHIAYYTSSGEEYDQLKPEFEKLGNFVHEAIINDRRVGVIKLYEPITYKKYEIEAVELIEPRKDEVHASGWEHAEFVTAEDYNSILHKYHNVKWETGSMDRPIYSHVTAVLETDMKLKFHHRSILDCIALERKQSKSD
jgi:predicted metalloenzyme YecM